MPVEDFREDHTANYAERTTHTNSLVIHPGLSYVESWERGYILTVPTGCALAIEGDTPLALEFYDSNGDKLYCEVTISKQDPQGRDIAHLYQAPLSQFNYERMRTDPKYYHRTRFETLLTEDERLMIRAEDDDFDPKNSSFSIGCTNAMHGKAAEIAHLDSLPPSQRDAVASASARSSRSGGSSRSEPRPTDKTAQNANALRREQTAVEIHNEWQERHIRRTKTDSEGRQDARVAYEDYFDEDEERLKELDQAHQSELERWWQTVDEPAEWEDLDAEQAAELLLME